MKMNRTHNAARNIVSGAAISIYQTVLPFVMRTVLIYRLGAAYSGLNNLFGTVLSVLNLAELGVGAAMNFSMYRPIAEDDTDTICALLRLYQRYYGLVGGVILVVGVAITPIIPRLVLAETVPADINIFVLYYLYLASCVFSYLFFPDRVGLIAAHQRSDVVNKLMLLTSSAAYALQIGALFLVKNFYLFTIVYMVMEIVHRFVLAFIANRMFPRYRPRGILPRAEKQAIHGRIRDLFTSRIGAVVLDSVDTLVISSYLGLTVLAIFQNYQFILNAVLKMIAVIFNAVLAGVGNSLVSESREKNLGDLHRLTFITCWIAGFCGACLTCLYQPLIEIWVGRDLMLGFSAVICFVVYFYLRAVTLLIDTYKDAAGVWHRDRIRPLVTSLVNLALNLGTVRYIGIYGIILSTVVSLLVVGIPWELYNIFTGVFARSSLRPYVGKLLYFSLLAVAACVLSWLVCSLIPLERWAALIVRGILCCILPNALFLLAYRKRPEYAESLELASSITGGRLDRILNKLRF